MEFQRLAVQFTVFPVLNEGPRPFLRAEGSRTFEYFAFSAYNLPPTADRTFDQNLVRERGPRWFTYSPNRLWSGFSRLTAIPARSHSDRTYLMTNVWRLSSPASGSFF